MMQRIFGKVTFNVIDREQFNKDQATNGKKK